MTTTPKPSPRQLAERIAEELMRYGDLMRYGENTGSGLIIKSKRYGLILELTRSAVIDRIVKVLEAEER